MSVETTATTTATPPTQDVANPRARRTNVIQPHPHRAPLGGEHIPYPATTTRRIVWPYAISFVVIHALALLAFVPWLFSWTGVALAFIGLYAFGTLGINLCYHRLLTHRGFTCPLWFEHALATIGVCCLQDTPARWTMIHRLHHQHSDDQPDPHSPLAEFFWGHIGWLVYENTQLSSLDTYEKYVPDLLRDRFYLQLEKRLRWFTVYVIHAVLFYLVGFGIGWATTGRFMGGVQFGSSLLVWGVFVRTVAVWHITWSINSVTHMWGYRNYETNENSRNNLLIGLISNGEGWHNNHHADQRSAAHGHMWWELDVTWLTIRFLEAIGIAKNVIRPRFKTADATAQD